MRRCGMTSRSTALLRQLSRREIAFELRTARRQGAAPDRVRDLELLLHELDERTKRRSR